MPLFIALLAGILFGIGLTVAQMVDPQKVLNFLDVAAIAKGGWDPSLLMVFAGALPVMFVAYRIRVGMERPAFETAFAIPTRTDIDAKLVGGSAIFGIGWGLAGLCPGPAVTGLTLAGSQLSTLVLYVAAMLIGVALGKVVRDGAPSLTAKA